jgi:hypothetical protein
MKRKFQENISLKRWTGSLWLTFVFDSQKLRRAKVEPEGLAALSP